MLLAPVAGGLVVGLMARYGSEKIRGHGMPEAIEAILMGGSKVQPRVAVLKPVSSAVAIGTGGPFGAEGPIIMTGGAIGSLLAQFLHLTADERKTLLVAGAAAGMAAIFDAPLAAVRAGRRAAAVRVAAAQPGPGRGRGLASPPWPGSRCSATGALFPLQAPLDLHPSVYLLCVVSGVLSGAARRRRHRPRLRLRGRCSRRLPVHWMWWPAIGGLVIGIGGLFVPAGARRRLRRHRRRAGRLDRPRAWSPASWW